MGKYEENKHWLWKEVPTTYRSIKEYFDHLHLNIGMIKGKKILDIGAGTRRFSKEVSELNIGTSVYSVDPLYSLFIDDTDMRLLKSGESIEYIKAFNIPEVRQRTVAALAYELPFRDKQFDLILSLFCFPCYANNEEQIRKFFYDIARLLKGGGETRLCPVSLGAIRKREVIRAIDVHIESGLFFDIIENKNDLLILRRKSDK